MIEIKGKNFIWIIDLEYHLVKIENFSIKKISGEALYISATYTETKLKMNGNGKMFSMRRSMKEGYDFKIVGDKLIYRKDNTEMKEVSNKVYNYITTGYNNPDFNIEKIYE